MNDRQQLIEQASLYIEQHQDELFELIKQLCMIPASSHHEEQRSAFIQNWLQDNGCHGSYIDEVNNVIFPYSMKTNQEIEDITADEDKDESIVAFMAHIDTVFPDRVPFAVKQDGNRLYCPGIGDDTTNVAVLMLMARFFAKKELPVKKKLLFVFDSCEEGLGNLKGCRHLFDTFGSSITQMVSFDGTYEGVCNQAVGSLRYQVEVRTEGGHSYSNFGNRNAIVYLSKLINDLYDIKVERGTTYNVGEISGGTSINTIAQHASMLYEIRSNDRAQMDQIRIFFEQMVEAHKLKGVDIHVTLLGERPCMGDVDEQALKALTDLASSVIYRHTGKRPDLYAGSTDCNIPFSRGVSATCFGAYLGKGAHTKEEYIEIDSVLTGSKIVSEFMMHYVG